MSDTHIPAALRREVIERAGNCCEYCRLGQNDNYFRYNSQQIKFSLRKLAHPD